MAPNVKTQIQEYRAMNPPEFPAGPNDTSAHLMADRTTLIEAIQTAPSKVREAVNGLSESQLETLYRNWSLRQIVHHMADSHANAFIRFKWALTEDQPLIKAYNQTLWAALPDSKSGTVDAPLALLAGLHACWVQLLKSMTDADFTRSFDHPETGQTVSLTTALNNYVWHSRHHTAQILWRRQERGW
jgi:uncharacterized damage-inducible protein DinB